jgi:hypothetical protein
VAFDSLGSINPFAFSNNISYSFDVLERLLSPGQVMEETSHFIRSISSLLHSHTQGSVSLLSLMDYAKIYKVWSA